MQSEACPPNLRQAERLIVHIFSGESVDAPFRYPLIHSSLELPGHAGSLPEDFGNHGRQIEDGIRGVDKARNPIVGETAGWLKLNEDDFERLLYRRELHYVGFFCCAKMLAHVSVSSSD